jgi:four helix bundle protein
MANILVIDDDLEIGKLLQMHLTDEGHHVQLTHMGEEGLTRAVEHIPDLIMLDVFLPDYTGFQICKQLRKTPGTQNVPIIMMTGAARFPNQQMYGFERGANEYISKPFNIVEVGELVHKYISNKAARPFVTDKPAGAEPVDHRSALKAILEQTVSPRKEVVPEPVKAAPASSSSMLPGLQGPLGDLIHFAHTPPAEISIPTPPVVPPAAPPAPVAAEVPAVSPAPVKPAEDFVPSALTAKESFIDFGLDVYALSSRLSRTQAEQYLASQLLRTSLSVGARLTLSRGADSRTEFQDILHAALHDLKETGYWLMIARKSGSLDGLAKNDLEKTCQSLITMLTDFVSAEKKRPSR